MSLGQTMITLGMFILLIMSVISANRMLYENPESQLQAQALTLSAGIANDLIAEMQSKPFDWAVRGAIDTIYVDSLHSVRDTLWKQATDSATIVNKKTTDLSAYQGTQWGVRNLISLPDTSSIGQFHSITGLKDVDDYDGYQRGLSYSGMSGFVVNAKVYYVASTAPDVLSSSNQFFKKIEVTVEQPQYLQKVTYTALASY